jgi:FkbM family methyltransferase
MAMAHRAMKTLSPDAVCVDVGAHTGEWLTYFTALSPEARHVAFEPLPHLVPGLRARFPDCVIHQAALADATGAATFHYVVNDPGWSGLLEQERYFVTPQFERIRVDRVRLDDALAQSARVDFVKVDVEGGELGVLAGGLRTLERFQPIVYFEHARIHFLNYGDISLPLYELLSGAGYSVLSLERETVLDRSAFVDIVQHAHEINYDFPAETNFIAAPRERLRQFVDI